MCYVITVELPKKLIDDELKLTGSSKIASKRLMKDVSFRIRHEVIHAVVERMEVLKIT